MSLDVWVEGVMEEWGGGSWVEENVEELGWGVGLKRVLVIMDNEFGKLLVV